MISSLAHEHGNFGSRSDYQRIDIRWSNASIIPIHHASGSLLLLHATSQLWNSGASSTRCYTRLMMCSIYIDESATVATAAWPSHLCVPFSEKLNHLLDHLDNWCKMHGSRSDALEWVRGNRKYIDYSNDTTLPGLQIPLVSCTDNHLAFISFISFRVPFSCPLLTTNGGQKRH
jgi:hypothetical protein